MIAVESISLFPETHKALKIYPEKSSTVEGKLFNNEHSGALSRSIRALLKGAEAGTRCGELGEDRDPGSPSLPTRGLCGGQEKLGAGPRDGWPQSAGVRSVSWCSPRLLCTGAANTSTARQQGARPSQLPQIYFMFSCAKPWAQSPAPQENV